MIYGGPTMTTEPRDTDPLFWLLRVTAIVVVLPLRIAGEVVVRAGDILLRWIGRPVMWLLHRARPFCRCGSCGRSPSPSS